MPNWNPNRNPVNWNHQAAREAINELRRAAQLLEESVSRRRQAAGVAQAEWRGRFREQFDQDLERMVSEARDLAGRMRRKAQQIEDASNRAQAETDHRRREIERWEREKKEEERRERERQERERRERGDD